MQNKVVAHIRKQIDSDRGDVARLMDTTFSAERTKRPVWHLRPGPPVDDLCFIAEFEGRSVSCLRFWEIIIAGVRQLLLGPLAVEPSIQGKGVGKALVRAGLSHAERLGRWDVVLVSGDHDYYPQFGFHIVSTSLFLWPGPLESERLHMRALRKGGETVLPPGPVALLAAQA